jgi:putative addiction module killer protein
MVTLALPSSLFKVREYVDLNGTSPFGDWLGTLDPTTRARVTVSILRLGQGNLAGAKSVGSGVAELRLDFGPGYRVYFGRDGERVVVLLIGGTKRRQQADIETAQRLWAEYKRRKRGE